MLRHRKASAAQFVVFVFIYSFFFNNLLFKWGQQRLGLGA